MIRTDLENKNCADCNQLITFKDFCRINPTFSLEQAKEFWDDSMFLIYCPECYFNLAESPFKTRRGYFNYYKRYPI